MNYENPLIVQGDRSLLLDVHAPLAEECRNALIPFAELEKVRLVFNFGARDTLLILKSGGVENHLSAILGFGVENVIR